MPSNVYRNLWRDNTNICTIIVLTYSLNSCHIGSEALRIFIIDQLHMSNLS